MANPLTLQSMCPTLFEAWLCIQSLNPHGDPIRQVLFLYPSTEEEWRHRKLKLSCPETHDSVCKVAGPGFKPRQFGFRIHALLIILSRMEAPQGPQSHLLPTNPWTLHSGKNLSNIPKEQRATELLPQTCHRPGCVIV